MRTRAAARKFSLRQGRHRGPLLALMAGCFALALMFVPRVLAQDSDQDEMPDAYELFFGLDPADPADGQEDPDHDMLLNADEALLGTDPYCADTDRDGLSDLIDESPLSRAYVSWGDPRFIEGATIYYPGPSWWLGGYRAGGAWVTEDPTSFVSARSGDGVYMLVDAEQIGSNIVLEVDFLDVEGSSLFVDVVDTNGTAILVDLFGNLITGSGELVSLNLPIAIPSEAPDQVAVGLRTGDGLVAVYESLLYVDRDLDGLDEQQELQFGSTDGVAMSDAEAAELLGQAERWESPSATPTDDVAAGRVDDDVSSSGSREGNVVYVNARTGDDGHDGLSRSRGGANAGPKRTISAGLQVAAGRAGWSVCVEEGVYEEKVRIDGVKVRTQGRVVIR